MAFVRVEGEDAPPAPDWIDVRAGVDDFADAGVAVFERVGGAARRAAMVLSAAMPSGIWPR
ncbi:MAG: hypothetical protein R2856_12660 [Caldilineaceae bacterium]